VKQLGESASSAVFPELAEHTRSDSPLVRRLAASALGKLAGVVDSAASVDLLRPLLTDPHPQVRQYAAKALGAFGQHAAKTLDDLRDMWKNPQEREYVKRSVLAAGQAIREAVRIAEAQTVRTCRRCGVLVSADEFARSHKAFQRVFCDKCFDEVYLERRNFDTKVELNKTIRAADGTLVQSDGERIVAGFLADRDIAFRYDERFRIVEGFAIRPDFYLPEFDLYVEYWGMDTTDYKIGMLKKQKLYQQEGKRVLSLHFRDKPRLREILAEKLGKFMRVVPANAPAPICGRKTKEELGASTPPLKRT
jgi:putative ubiquitin-RnfH superfamily antitoxin RatB of RatAB toxin-antitoxin module